MSSPRRGLEPLLDDQPETTPRRGLPEADAQLEEHVAAPRRTTGRVVGTVAGLAVAAVCAVSFLASPTGTTAAVPAPAASSAREEVKADELSRGMADRTPLADTTVSESAPADPTSETPAAEAPAAPAPTDAAPAQLASAAPAPAGTTAAAAPKQSVVYATADINLRAAADSSSKLVDVISSGTKMTAIGDASGSWQQVQVGSRSGFVSVSYVSSKAPASASPTAQTTATKAAAASAAPTASSATTTKAASSGGGGVQSSYPACGSPIDGGISARAANVKRAICNTYGVTNFGGWRADGEHSSGRAFDAMVSGAKGREIAAWLRANASTLGITEIIYEQKIWTQQRSSEGWRSMSDRGSTTANHYDHIHVLVG